MIEIFKDYPDFTPNLKPYEILQMGSFGGTYFRDIYSSITKINYVDTWKELPEFWISNLHTDYYKSDNYNININKYKVKCGSPLSLWESSGWINPQDPYGWFQWYCRFYCGRRTDDDKRQINRWLRLAGPKGRFRKQFLNKVDENTYFDPNFMPTIRQTLLHWAFIFE